jgi:hypothetical protein
MDTRIPTVGNSICSGGYSGGQSGALAASARAVGRCVLCWMDLTRMSDTMSSGRRLEAQPCKDCYGFIMNGECS